MNAMSEDSGETAVGPYDELLGAQLEKLREELPGRPLPYYRMLLIQALHDEQRLEGKEAREAVDEYYGRHGLALPQPTVLQAIGFALLVAAVLLVPLGLVYWLWQYLQSR